MGSRIDKSHGVLIDQVETTIGGLRGQDWGSRPEWNVMLPWQHGSFTPAQRDRRSHRHGALVRDVHVHAVWSSEATAPLQSGSVLCCHAKLHFAAIVRLLIARPFPDCSPGIAKYSPLPCNTKVTIRQKLQHYPMQASNRPDNSLPINGRDLRSPTSNPKACILRTTWLYRVTRGVQPIAAGNLLASTSAFCRRSCRKRFSIAHGSCHPCAP